MHRYYPANPNFISARYNQSSPNPMYRLNEDLESLGWTGVLRGTD